MEVDVGGGALHNWDKGAFSRLCGIYFGSQLFQFRTEGGGSLHVLHSQGGVWEKRGGNGHGMQRRVVEIVQA